MARANTADLTNVGRSSRRDAVRGRCDVLGQIWAALRWGLGILKAGLKELLPGRPLVSYVDDARRLSEASLAARRGFKLSDVVLCVVLAIALFEPWFANRISLKHYLKPRDDV